jgi:DNA replication and repair protein RecF
VLDAAFGPGPQLVWGPNAAGKTSLLEAIVLAAWGRSHRTAADGELVRWGAELARVEARVGTPDASTDGRPARDAIEVALVRTATGGARKRIRVNGVARRAPALVGVLRTVLFAPEEMLLVAGSPSLRREAVDRLAGQRSPAYLRDLATYGRALQQRNGLLRLIREEQAGRDELRFWDASLLEAGTAVREERQRLLEALAGPLAAAHAEIAPDEATTGRLGLRYETNAPQLPDESVRDALGRRLVDTAEKEVWNGTTLIGPHRDDVVFELGGRDLASFASRGQQRTAILAFKLAELDLLTALDGRPPLLLLDDVFSELDPERRAHLVRRIAALPQAFVTTTTLEDLDPALRSVGSTWAVTVSDGTSRLDRGA